MIWQIVHIILAFGEIKGNPVDNGSINPQIIEDDGSYIVSIFTTLLQAVVVSSMSVVLLYGMFSLKSRFNSNRTEQRLEQRLYKCGSSDIHGGDNNGDNPLGIFGERRRIVDLESIPVWQVPKVKSHRTNH